MKSVDAKSTYGDMQRNMGTYRDHLYTDCQRGISQILLLLLFARQVAHITSMECKQDLRLNSSLEAAKKKPETRLYIVALAVAAAVVGVVVVVPRRSRWSLLPKLEHGRNVSEILGQQHAKT